MTSIRNILAGAAVVVATAVLPGQAMAATAADPVARAQAADCGGAEEKAWAETSGSFRTIYYTNCRDQAVRRQAYVLRLLPSYLGCKNVAPGATVSWTTSNDAALWGIASC